jgi:hypothetical protein
VFTSPIYLGGGKLGSAPGRGGFPGKRWLPNPEGGNEHLLLYMCKKSLYYEESVCDDASASRKEKKSSK